MRYSEQNPATILRIYQAYYIWYRKLFDIVNKKGLTDLFAISRFECTLSKASMCFALIVKYDHYSKWLFAYSLLILTGTLEKDVNQTHGFSGSSSSDISSFSFGWINSTFAEGIWLLSTFLLFWFISSCLKASLRFLSLITKSRSK